MLRNETIKIRATRHGITIVCDPRASLSDVVSALRARLKTASNFFADATVKVDFGEREVSRLEVEPLRTVLEEEFHLRLSGVVCSQHMLLRRAAKDLGVPVEVEADTVTAPSPPAGGLNAGGLNGETLLIRHTCRSGFKVDYPGNVVIVGDVNSGAEVVAEKDIIVVGALRGTAQAGAGGDTSAMILALVLEPKQLRIAGHLALPPSEESHAERSKPVFTSEVAYIEGDRIVIEPYKGRFPSS